MSKTYILDGFAHFVAAPDPMRKLVSGAFKEQVCASETISCLVATNMLNPQL